MGPALFGLNGGLNPTVFFCCCGDKGVNDFDGFVERFEELLDNFLASAFCLFSSIRFRCSSVNPPDVDILRAENKADNS